MDRRDLIKASLLGLFVPFNIKIPNDVTVKDDVASAKSRDVLGKRYYSPYFKGFGLATEIQLSINYNLDYMSAGLDNLSPNFRYINFPVEAIVDIQYEHGAETWSGFNPRNHALKQFSMKRFFGAKFVEGACDYGGQIELDGVVYKLATVTVR